MVSRLEPLRLPEGFWSRVDVCEALAGRDLGALFRLVGKWGGASQTKIAIAVGMTQGQVSVIMAGKRQVIAIDVAERALDGLAAPDTARVAFGLAPRGSSASPGAESPEPGVAASPTETSDLVKHRSLSADGNRIADAAMVALDLGQDIEVPLAPRLSRGGAVTAGAGCGAGDGLADWEEPTKRRELVKNASVAAIGAVLADTMVESSELSRWQEASALGAVTPRHLDLAVARFGLIYLHTPPVELFSEVRACRMRVGRLLEGRHTLSQQRHLYVVAGWLSGLLGHLSLDLGSEAAASAHCLTAWELARESGDNTLAAWVRGTQAMIATYAGAAQEAVALARSGQTLVKGRRASVQYVRLAAHEGRALARRGDLKGTRDAFARAEQVAGKLDDKPTGSILSFDTPYLPFYAGTAYGWLGESTLARQYAVEAIRLCDAAPADWPVARALARIDLAGTYVAQDDCEKACAVAMEALDIHDRQRPVDPILRRAAELSGRMAGHGTLPEVVEFEERRRALRSPGQPTLTSE